MYSSSHYMHIMLAQMHRNPREHTKWRFLLQARAPLPRGVTLLQYRYSHTCKLPNKSNAIALYEQDRKYSPRALYIQVRCVKGHILNVHVIVTLHHPHYITQS